MLNIVSIFYSNKSFSNTCLTDKVLLLSFYCIFVCKQELPFIKLIYVEIVPMIVLSMNLLTIFKDFDCAIVNGV